MLESISTSIVTYIESASTAVQGVVILQAVSVKSQIGQSDSDTKLYNSPLSGNLRLLDNLVKFHLVFTVK